MSLTREQKEAVRKDFLEWSGGFGPHEHADPDYVECGAYDASLDPADVDEFLDEWRASEEAKIPGSRG